VPPRWDLLLVEDYSLSSSNIIDSNDDEMGTIPPCPAE
jgi:hypothetical protein